MLLTVVFAAARAATPSTTTISELLHRLEASGTEVLYSSDLVPAEMRAPDPGPTPTPDLLTHIVSALAAHGLQLNRIDERHFVVAVQPTPARPLVSNATVPAAAAPPLSALEEVLVFASHYTFKRERSGESNSVDHRSLELIAGTQSDAVRAVRAAPGVASTYSSRPYIRGGSADDVLIRFDGIALTNPFHFRAFQSLISPFVPAAVERIDIYSGGFPVRFGTRAAGVIDIAPRAMASGYELQGNVSRHDVDLAGAGRLARWPIEWLTTVRRSTDSTNVLEPIDAIAREPTFFDALGRIRWQMTPTASVTAGWLLLNDQARVRAHDTNQLASARSRDVYVWLAWNWSPPVALRVDSSIAFTRSENSHFGRFLVPGVADGKLFEDHDFSVITAHSEWAYAPDPFTVWNFGAELAAENAALEFRQSENFAALLLPTFERNTTVSVNYAQSPRSLTSALFASRRRRWRAFETELGVRVDRQDYRDMGVRAQLAPRLTMRYDATADWHLYASWGAFSQAQRVDEYRKEENQSSPDSADRATHSVLGFSREVAGAVQWRVEAYRNHWTSARPYYDNVLGLVTLLPELQPDRIRIAPSGAQSDGLELSARCAFGSHLEGWGSYTLSEVFDELPGRAVARSWDQRHALNLGAAWRQSRINASLLLGWHSGWPRTAIGAYVAPSGGRDYLLLGPRNAQRWGGYLSLEAHLAYTVPVHVGDLSLWVDISNAGNRSNECCNDLSPVVAPDTLPKWSTDAWAGRKVALGLSWHLQHGRL